MLFLYDTRWRDEWNHQSTLHFFHIFTITSDGHQPVSVISVKCIIQCWRCGGVISESCWAERWWKAQWCWCKERKSVSLALAFLLCKHTVHLLVSCVFLWCKSRDVVNLWNDARGLYTVRDAFFGAGHLLGVDLSQYNNPCGNMSSVKMTHLSQIQNKNELIANSTSKDTSVKKKRCI